MADLTLVQGLNPQQKGLASLLQGVNTGLGIRDTLNQRKDAKLLNSILSMSGDDVQMTAARQSGRAGTLVPKIAEMQSTRLKAEADRQKTQAEIGKLGAESGKLGAETEKTALGMGVDRAKVTMDALGGLTAMGDGITKTAVLQQLMGLTNLGVLTPEMAMNEYNALPDDPMQLQQYVQSKMPIGEQTTRRGQDMTQETALRGQDMTQETAMYGQDAQTGRTNATIAAANQRQVNQITAQQQRGQIIQGANGFFRVDPVTGAAVPVTANGEQIRATSKNAETPQQAMERQTAMLTAEGAGTAGRRAAEAARLLLTNQGLEGATGFSGLVLRRIPSTKSRSFAADVENLKSQLFLPTIQQMRGMGALSNAEGAKVEAAVQNLDLAVDDEDFKRRLSLVAEQMDALANLADKEYQIYATRGGFNPQAQPPQQAAPPAQVAITRAQAEAAARQAGVSMEQAIEAYRARGIEVR